MTTVSAPEKIGLGETRFKTAPSKYARFQVKVSDAVILCIPTLIVGLLLTWIALVSGREFHTSFLMLAAVISIVAGPLLLSWLLALRYTPVAKAQGLARRRHLYKYLGWAVPFTLLLGAVAIPNLLVSRIQLREMAAMKALRSLATEQKTFRLKNSSAQTGYATSLNQLFTNGKNQELVNAEYGFGRKGMEPFNSYYFKVLTKQGPGAKGGELEYLDAQGHLTRGFGLVALPATSGGCGMASNSFMINQDGEMYQRDFGSYTNEMIDEMVFDPKDWKRAE